MVLKNFKFELDIYLWMDFTRTRAHTKQSFINRLLASKYKFCKFHKVHLSRSEYFPISLFHNMGFGNDSVKAGSVSIISGFEIEWCILNYYIDIRVLMFAIYWSYLDHYLKEPCCAYIVFVNECRLCRYPQVWIRYIYRHICSQLYNATILME